MNPAYKIWFSSTEDSNRIMRVSFSLLDNSYNKLVKDWIQAEEGVHQRDFPAEYFFRHNGGFAMVLKLQCGGCPSNILPLSSRPATHIEFASQSPELLRQIVLEEIGLPYIASLVQVVDRQAHTTRSLTEVLATAEKIQR
jgi:hypothetical protein